MPSSDFSLALYTLHAFIQSGWQRSSLALHKLLAFWQSGVAAILASFVHVLRIINYAI